jgi:hypothetical protein
MLDELAIDYVLGGSFAGSFFGEPRATADVDIAIQVGDEDGERLIGRAQGEFYLPTESARLAIKHHDSFNLVDTSIAFKIDLFVLGDNLLDRQQLTRRILVPVPGITPGLWVTSPEDQILRKLEWFRAGGESSDQQWRDILGILRVNGTTLDRDYLKSIGVQLGLEQMLQRSLDESGLDSSEG